MPKTTDQCDVVVVGAGMAGITAARDISARGLSVILLEARNRIGGRTYRENALGGELELGGAYVHWTQPNVWNELQRHDMAVLEPPLQSETVYWLADGVVNSGTEPDWFNAIKPPIERLFADARIRFPLPYQPIAMDNTDIENQTLAQHITSLQMSQYDRDTLEGALSGVIHSCDKHGSAQLLHAAAASFGNYLGFLEAGGVWTLPPGGTRKLIDSILRQCSPSLQLYLSSPVKSIIDDGARVTVATRAGRHVTARAAVVAVPINTLSDIRFEPQLPSSVCEMLHQDGGPNPVRACKLWARVRGEVEPFSALAPPGKCAISAARVEKPWHNGDTLVLCMCADAGLIPSTPESRREAVQEALRTFVPEIEVVDTALYDWNSDEFSKGGWMIHRPGGFTGAGAEIREPHGRVHFAGSDISAMAMGTIEGAMQSGAAAARNVFIHLEEEQASRSKI